MRKKKKMDRLYQLLEEVLSDVPDEDDCSDDENEFYADCQNLKESICQLTESDGDDDIDGCDAGFVETIESACREGILKAYTFKEETRRGIRVDYVNERTDSPEFAYTSVSVMQIENGVILARLQDNYGFGKNIVMGMEHLK